MKCPTFLIVAGLAAAGRAQVSTDEAYRRQSSTQPATTIKKRKDRNMKWAPAAVLICAVTASAQISIDEATARLKDRQAKEAQLAETRPVAKRQPAPITTRPTTQGAQIPDTLNTEAVDIAKSVRVELLRFSSASSDPMLTSANKDKVGEDASRQISELLNSISGKILALSMRVTDVTIYDRDRRYFVATGEISLPLFAVVPNTMSVKPVGVVHLIGGEELAAWRKGQDVEIPKVIIDRSYISTAKNVSGGVETWYVKQMDIFATVGVTSIHQESSGELPQQGLFEHGR